MIVKITEDFVFYKSPKPKTTKPSFQMTLYEELYFCSVGEAVEILMRYEKPMIALAEVCMIHDSFNDLGYNVKVNRIVNHNN